jgi:uncharacterized protein (TIRG00374 family)
MAQALLLRRRGVLASSAVALYTFDRVIDAVFFLCAVPVLVLTLSARPTGLLGDGLVMVSLLLLGGLLALVLLLSNYRRLLLRSGPWLDRLRLSRRRRHRIARGVIRFRRALRTAGRMPRAQLARLLFYCVCQWFNRYAVLLILITLGLGLDISASYLFAVQLIGLGVGQATMMPGGGGSADLSIGALLAPVADGASIAAALLAWRLCTSYFQLATGGAAFAWMLNRQRAQHG